MLFLLVLVFIDPLMMIIVIVGSCIALTGLSDLTLVALYNYPGFIMAAIVTILHFKELISAIELHRLNLTHLFSLGEVSLSPLVLQTYGRTIGVAEDTVTPSIQYKRFFKLI